MRALFNEGNGKVLYRGYVDDPRNTDHAWMETVAMHFHCPSEVAGRLKLHAGDDATAVTWLEVGDHNPSYRALYASHKQIVDLVDATHGVEALRRQQAERLAMKVGGSGDGSPSRKSLNVSFKATAGADAAAARGSEGGAVASRSSSSEGGDDMSAALAKLCARLCGRPDGDGACDGGGGGGDEEVETEGSSASRALDLQSICPGELGRAIACVKVLTSLRGQDGTEADAADLADASKKVALAVSQVDDPRAVAAAEKEAAAAAGDERAILKREDSVKGQRTNHGLPATSPSSSPSPCQPSTCAASQLLSTPSHLSYHAVAPFSLIPSH